MERACAHNRLRAAISALVLGLCATMGLGCQCHTAEQTRAGQAPLECGPIGEDVVETQRQSARRRANEWLEVVEYEPASFGTIEALAVRSYPQADGSLGQRSFIYDAALALLWFAWMGDEHTAMGLAETLIYLQRPDGGWGFSFAIADARDYHASFVRSGTVAWASHALGYFGERFGKPRSVRAARRGADFLRRMRLGSDGLVRGLISAGHGEPSSPQDAEAGAALPYAVSEHQFDAHLLLSHYEPMAAERLAERMLEVLWMEQEGRFAVAATAEHLNEGRALDAAGAWGALWLLSVDDHKRARRSYEYTREHFATEAGELYGFRPYEDSVDGYDPGRARDHIFVEVTMSMGLLAHRLGDRDTARRVLETGVRLSCQGPPGLPYSNVDVPGFSTRPAAASTLWFLFFERELRTGLRAPLFAAGRSQPVVDKTR
jgi:hypothetical protein